MGTMVAGAKLAVGGGQLQIVSEGKSPKFVAEVEHVTFSGDYARQNHQLIYYLTERALFRLGPHGLILEELAPGLDLERDVLAQMAFRPEISPHLRTMDSKLFCPEPLGLARASERSLSDRLEYRDSENLVFVDFEGLRVANARDVDCIRQCLVEFLSQLPGKVDVVVNYDHFWVDPNTQETYWQMVAEIADRYYLSSARYSSNAFQRRHLAAGLARIGRGLFGNFAQAIEHLS